MSRIWSRASGVAMAFPVLFAAIMTYAVGARGPFSETVYFEIALRREGGSGWLYPYDDARALMMLPYKLATIIDPGSYWPFQFIQFALLALVGVLVAAFTAIAWDLTPRIAAVAGSVAVVFGGDLSGAFSGMVIVRQTMVFWLGALVLLALASRSRWWIAVLAIPLELAASFTYDPVLVALIASPLLILAARRTPWTALVAWYLPIAGIAAWQVWRYAVEATSSYQSEQLASVPFWTMLGRLGRLLATALTPLVWPTQWTGAFDMTDASTLLALAGWGTAAIALGIACVVLLPSRRRPTARRPAMAWGATALLLLACIAPYLVILQPFAPPATGYPDGPWRSLLLAAVPVAMAAGLLANALNRQRAWQAAYVAVLLGCGVSAGVAAQLSDQTRWREYVSVLGSLKQLAPSLRPGTLVVLEGIPRASKCRRCAGTPTGGTDPFTSSIWFNSALQLAYPDVGVVGTYREESGQWAPDTTVVATPSGINLPYVNVSVAMTRFRPNQVLLVGWNAGHLRIEVGNRPRWPFTLTSSPVSAARCAIRDTPLIGSLPGYADACEASGGS